MNTNSVSYYNCEYAHSSEQAAICDLLYHTVWAADGKMVQIEFVLFRLTAGRVQLLIMYVIFS
jgi:hypothetical protein